MHASRQDLLDRWDVSRETISRIAMFIGLLYDWQKRINLISTQNLSKNEFEEMVWNRHILDSLQLIPHIYHQNDIIDLGSGGGFPGLVLSLHIKNKIYLVESDKRKCEFLKEAIRLTSSDAQVINDRIENLNEKDFPNLMTITSRACASILKLLDLTKQFHPRANYVLLKGEKAGMELDQIKGHWHADYELHPSVTDGAANIVTMTGIKHYA